MQDIFIRIILFILIICGIIFFVKRKNKYELLTNNIFWLSISWLVCLFLYYFSGINYTIKVNFTTVSYIFVVLGLFICRSNFNAINKQEKNKRGEKSKYRCFKKNQSISDICYIFSKCSYLYNIYFIN